MVIRYGDNFVEIVATNRVPENEPTPGDTRLVITVCSHGFAGQGAAWIAAPCLAAFVQQLRVLEERRHGSAAIESLSPGEFHLRIWSVDHRGQIAVGGRLLRRVHGRAVPATATGKAAPCT
jgi:hypothetical protein